MTINRPQAAALGISAATVGHSLRAFFGGDAVAHFRAGENTYDIVLALHEKTRANAGELTSLPLRSHTQALVELGRVTRILPGQGPGQISRGDKQREIRVQANLDGMSLGEGMKFIEALGQKLPAGVHWSFEGEAKSGARSAKAFGGALSLALVLVFMILAAQFESLLDPVAIMMALPFALIGAMGGLLVTGSEASIYAAIGVIMLMGLVTKNSILLIEFARQAKEQGRTCHQALIEAGRVRLRPILMTTLAMIAGMVPAAMAQGEGSEGRAAMAAVIIGGLLSSTVLTLGIVPVVYALLDAMRARLGKLWLARARLEVAP